MTKKMGLVEEMELTVASLVLVYEDHLKKKDGSRLEEDKKIASMMRRLKYLVDSDIMEYCREVKIQIETKKG